MSFIIHQTFSWKSDMNVYHWMNNNKGLMIIILHVNDTVKPKISKLPYTPTTLFTSCIFEIKPILKQFTKWDNFKGALSGLMQFLATEILLKNDEKCFFFTSKALFILKIFKGYLHYKTFLCYKVALDV